MSPFHTKNNFEIRILSSNSLPNIITYLNRNEYNRYFLNPYYNGGIIYNQGIPENWIRELKELSLEFPSILFIVYGSTSLEKINFKAYIRRGKGYQVLVEGVDINLLINNRCNFKLLH